MTSEEAIAALDALDGKDPEENHTEADGILLSQVPPDVAAAYVRLSQERAWGWWTA